MLNIYCNQNPNYCISACVPELFNEVSLKLMGLSWDWKPVIQKSLSTFLQIYVKNKALNTCDTLVYLQFIWHIFDLFLEHKQGQLTILTCKPDRGTKKTTNTMPVQLQSFLWPPIPLYSSYLVTSGQWYSWVKFNTALMLIKELACFPQCGTGLLPLPWILYSLKQTLTLWSGTRSLQAVTQCYKLRKQKYTNLSGQSYIWRCIPNARVTEPQKQCETWTAGTGEWTELQE